MKGSRVGYWLAKVMGVAVVALAVTILHGWFSKSAYVTVGDDFLSQAEAAVWVSLLMFMGFIDLFRFGVVDSDDDGVEIRRNGSVGRVPWGEVAAFHQIPFTAPPVYRLSFTSETNPVYFMMSASNYISIGIWSWDFTSFPSFVRGKMAASRRSAA